MDELTPEGRAQAVASADQIAELAGHRPILILYSPLRRAKETAWVAATTLVAFGGGKVWVDEAVNLRRNPLAKSDGNLLREIGRIGKHLGVSPDAFVMLVTHSEEVAALMGAGPQFVADNCQPVGIRDVAPLRRFIDGQSAGLR